MTSFIIKAQADRPPNETWKSDPECTFCRIIKGELPVSKVYEDDDVIAILDILPLRQGHTLVIPKIHISRLSELPPHYAAAVGRGVSKVAHALTQALNNTGLNVVCNQEYAQAVPHVHYHIVPAPKFGVRREVQQDGDKVIGGQTAQVLTHQEMHRKEFEAREELDEDEAEVLVKQIKSKL